MPKFRKKPVVIEAVQFTDKGPDVHYDILMLAGGIDTPTVMFNNDEQPRTATIMTLEGEMTASLGDWIIKGVKGEIYPCKPDIFEATYELVEDAPDLYADVAKDLQVPRKVGKSAALGAAYKS